MLQARCSKEGGEKEGETRGKHRKERKTTLLSAIKEKLVGYTELFFGPSQYRGGEGIRLCMHLWLTSMIYTVVLLSGLTLDCCFAAHQRRSWGAMHS